MVFKVLHESLINNLISSTIGVLLLQTREQSWRHGNLVLCRPRAKLCPLARRTYFSGWRAVSHADLVWKSRADLESALGVPFGGNLVENRPEPGNSSNFPLAPLGPDMPRASGHAQPGTGDGGWPEAGWETAAGRAVTRRLGVARNRSRERHHRQHPEPAARMGAFRCPCLEDFIGLPCCNLLALGSPCHLLGVPWICNLLALGSPRHLLGVPLI